MGTHTHTQTKEMLRAALIFGVVAVCLATPVQNTAKVVSMDDLETQALVVLQKADGPSVFKNFLPLVNHAVVYTSAILPSVKASKEHKHMSELTAGVLVQTVNAAANPNTELAEIEKYLPTGDDMMTAMIAIGNVIGGSSGFNPIEMMSNVVGKDEMAKVVEDIMKFPLRFPELTEAQLMNAEQVMLSIGLGFTDQEAALDSFMNILTTEQKDMIDNLSKEVMDKLVNSMSGPNGEPTPALIEEIKREMRVMEQRKGNTDMMPEEFKQLVRENAQKVGAEDPAPEALIAIQTSAGDDGKFSKFLPLINQAVVYTSAVLPTIKAKKEHKRMSELTEGALVQTVASAGGNPPSELAELEKYMPTAEDMLSAMVAIGNVIGGSSGFNPIQMMTNVVGKDDMAKAIDEIMKFPLRFPEPTEAQMEAAEQVALTLGLGFGSQESAINQFMGALSPEQKAMLNSLQTNVIDKVLNSMMTPNGEPTPALIEEIKREMREMQQKKGNTDMMPEEFKQLVAERHD